MKPLHVAFLWHMHQPFYKDSLKSRYLMPWVRLHATKGYFDMIDLLDDYPEMKLTFNLVPSLMLQLTDYCQKETTDPFLEHTLIPAKDLTDEGKQFILKHFFMANWDNMIKPYPRYWELLVKRGFSTHGLEIEKAVKTLQPQDFQDLQAWINLAWFGYRAKKHFPEITALIQKGRDFLDKDIQRIVEIQKEVLQKIIPSYKKASDEGRIEISTSPFYHPIMPLVYDTQFASRCLPSSPLPKRFSYPEDVESQTQKGIDFIQKIFKTRPKGLWPSEGSVCPELIPILAKLGINWIATDEEILTHSASITNRGAALFKPHHASYGKSSVEIFFRDRGLSDFIGFTYAHNPSRTSVENLLEHLSKIHEHTQHEDAVVSIILDGENAWENYADGGEGFLRGVYGALSENSVLIPTTFSHYLKDHPPKETLTTLHTGSWIHHDFDIWIGSEEENTAWDYLNRTRNFVKGLEGKISKAKLESILEQIYIAEGSDWFWWYGDDFSTDNDEVFDRLFRLHLASCYEIAGREVPEYLHQPIIQLKAPPSLQYPVGFIDPIIDGRMTHFFEWHGAGLYEVPLDTAMHRFQRYIHRIYFGFNFSTLFIRMDPFPLKHIQDTQGARLSIFLTKPYNYKIVLPRLFSTNKKKEFILFSSTDGINYCQIKEYSSASFDKILEIALPFKDLNCEGGQEVKFKIFISKGDMIQEMHPKFGYLNFTVPTQDFETEMWNA